MRCDMACDGLNAFENICYVQVIFVLKNMGEGETR